MNAQLAVKEVIVLETVNIMLVLLENTVTLWAKPNVRNVRQVLSIIEVTRHIVLLARTILIIKALGGLRVHVK